MHARRANFIPQAEGGVRFKLFVQPPWVQGFERPELISVSLKPGDVQPGPEDNRMYAIDAIKEPYGEGYPGDPPFPRNGALYHPPTSPNSEGHFDHLIPGEKEFDCAGMYATVRRVLDVWEKYFNKEIKWFFQSPRQQKLELIPHVKWNNAQSGGGFLEFGYATDDSGRLDERKPYCLNFDVLAHEMGHTIIFCEVGFPNSRTETAEYGGFHESAGDLVAMISSLHFDIMVDRLLERTKGNLFTKNVLSTLAELNEAGAHIRLGFNNQKMSDVSTEPHDLSEPLTGAIFDIMAEIYQDGLVQRGLIDEQLRKDSNHIGASLAPDEEIQARFTEFYNRNKEGFKEELIKAREVLGHLLATTWSMLSPHGLSYSSVANLMIRADKRLNEGKYEDIIRDSFIWREIAVRDSITRMREAWEWLEKKQLNKVNTLQANQKIERYRERSYRQGVKSK